MALDLEKLLGLLDHWIKAEDDTIEMTNKISGTTENPTIKLFMTAIRSDSAKHKLIQEYLKGAMTRQAPVVSPDEIATISGMINDHLELEQKTVDYGVALTRDMNLPIIKQLFEYLLDDERKHVTLLTALADLKNAATSNT